MSYLFAFLALISAIFLIRGLITAKMVGKKTSRARAGLVFGGLTLLLLFFVGVTAPPAVQDMINTTSDVKANTITEEGPEVTTDEVVETETIPFTTAAKDDSSLPFGQTQVAQEGVDGVKMRIYSVTYTDGIETNRALISETITTQPVEKIVYNGAYVAPKPRAASCSSGYINVDGNCVRSPSNDPAGATAECNDGTYSYSQNRRGTCSHHGGVARWL